MDHSPEYWRGCAEEVRTLAESTPSIEGGNVMLRIAEIYDELAHRYERLAERAARHPGPDEP